MESKMERLERLCQREARRLEIDNKIVVVKGNIKKYERLLAEAKEEWHDLVKERKAI